MRTDLLRRSATSSYCNYKGVATYWSIAVGDLVIDDIAWSYEDPPPESLPIKGFLSFDADRVDVVAELPQSLVIPRNCPGNAISSLGPQSTIRRASGESHMDFACVSHCEPSIGRSPAPLHHHDDAALGPFEALSAGLARQPDDYQHEQHPADCACQCHSSAMSGVCSRQDVGARQIHQETREES